MKVTVTRDNRGLTLDFSTNDWNHYEVLGMLEQAKFMVHKEIEKMVEREKAHDTPPNQSSRART